MNENINLSEKLIKLIDVAMQAREKDINAASNTQVNTQA